MKALVVMVLAAALAATVSAQQVYRSGDAGVVLPSVLKSVKPQYTQAAMQQQIQGRTLLECVVQADGNVGDISVIESLDSMYGLDEEAIKALKQWEFRPGTRDQQPVAVRVQVVMSFTLK